jgi:dipeptidase
LSAGSYVGHLTEKLSTHWLTGTSNPCISVFIPTFLNGAGSSEIFSKGSSLYEDYSPWWRHERLSRIVQLDYSHRAPPIQVEIQQIEKSFLEEAERIRDRALEEQPGVVAKALRDFTEKCSKRVHEVILKWTTNSLKIGSVESAPLAYRNFWDKYNAKAKLPL